MSRTHALLAALLVAVGTGTAHAADDIVIGAIYPMSGSLANAGADARNAIETMVEIVNGAHDVPMLMGHGGGLPHKGGAHIRVVFADHQSDPQKARAEAERLITQEHVVALIGTFQSAAAATVSQVAERYQMPFLIAEGSSPSLTKRGLAWTFRASPHDEMFTAAMFDFFKAQGAKSGHPVQTVALIYEDSIFGSDSSKVQRQLAEAAGLKVAADIRYRANSPSMSAEAQRLKAAAADVVMPTSYTNDAILLVRSMNEVGYKPHAVMAQATGFADQAFLTAVGPLAEGDFSRSAFALDVTKARPAIAPVNEMFRARANKDLNDTTSREVVAVQVMADAIDRARSLAPEDIRKALVATDIKGEDTIMPWKAIRFDDTGQNQDASPVIQQVHDGKYHTVFPEAVATEAAVWPVP